MKLSQFKFNLPKELIVDKPSDNRDEARMMVVHRKTGEIEHRIFKDLIDYFEKDDVIVANNSKVFPSRLFGKKEKTGANITVLLLRELNEETHLWDVTVDPARKIRIGNKLYFGPNDTLIAEVIDNTTSRGRTVRFLYDGSHEEFIQQVREMGSVPLPDEILRMRDVKNWDADRFQTIYAKHEGSIAAPIAGLHFSRELLKRLEIKDVKWTELTLHLGLGNFKDIEVEDLSKHRMDAEDMIISKETAEIVNEAIVDGRHVCAVGTTTMRALESAVTIPGKIGSYEGWTNKFIFPPYEFSAADSMVTNFHHPLSSQFIMVSAFGGPELIMKAYHEAIKEKYHFSIYGDAMLIL